MLYNASRLDLWYLPTVQMIYHGEFYPEPPSDKPFGVVSAERVAELVADYTGPNVCIDVEGSLVPDTLQNFPELKNWHWDGNFATASWWRYIIAMAIPAEDRHRFGFYDSHRKEMGREEIIGHLYGLLGQTYVPVYPQPGHDISEWRQRLILRYGRALYFTGRKPRILITYRTEDFEASAREFSDMLYEVQSLGLDAVFWVGSAVSDLPPAIDAVLWANRDAG